ncbi:MAG: selenium-dependent xanthine dehydrogenase [Hydrogenoanaerobacterium sp.]
MSKFIVNGEPAEALKDEKLIYFLRDSLNLTSVKNGCSEGACGTCMVLVDGKATKACILTTARVEGKSIITAEGLTEREKDVYGYAFSHAGAVQCGFCTPGMVISAKALLDVNLSPTRADVKEAIKNNICRCTGYKKIEDAILLAASIFKENSEVPHHDFTGIIGENLHRVDAAAKALGTAEYADDLYPEGMLYGGAVRSGHARAKVLSIDVSAAKALKGVAAVMTAADLPGNQKVGHLKKDYDVLIPEGKITHFAGDAIVLVAAESRELLEEARSLVKVEYEVLTPVLSPTEAMAEGAPKVHEGGNLLADEHLKRGDADARIKASKYVVTTKYSTPFTDHAFLEPETAVAMPDNDGILVYCGDQGIYQTRRECAEALGLPEEKVRVIAKMVGGGFGGKEDMSVQHYAALLAFKSQKPVKFALTRKESILVHPKRHPMEMEFTTACDENGKLTAMKATIISDTGAYASLGGPVLQRACTHAAGPYNYQDIDIEGRAYYTNNPPAGAFRGFGVTQSCFATECNLNLLAEKVGISPWEMRYRNAIRPGETLPNGQIADDSTALAETLEAVKSYMDEHPKAGIACAIKNSGLGVGIPDVGRCRLVVEDGKVHIYSSAACIGQGLGTVMTQMVCTTLKLPPEKVVYCEPDTSKAPNSGNTTASRQTVFTGEATRRASLALRDALGTASLESLNGQEFKGEYSSETDKMGSDKPHPVSHVAYGYATHVVDLDENGKLSCVLAAHDVGAAINPVNVEGQIEGGVVMSLGYALTEDFPLKEGVPTAKFGTLGLFKATQVPPIKAIIVEKSKEKLAYGAKGIGEICSIPTPPAVQLAYYNYDGNFRTKLPLENTPYSRKK